MTYDRESLMERIVRMKDKEQNSRLASWEQELKVTAARVRELEKLMESLYKDKYDGVIPASVFQTLMQRYETERAQKAAAIPDLERKVQEQRMKQNDASRWANLIQKYSELTELDETILLELVERIEIGETQIQNGIRFRDVKVFYRYVGNVDEAMDKAAQHEAAV